MPSRDDRNRLKIDVSGVTAWFSYLENLKAFSLSQVSGWLIVCQSFYTFNSTFRLVQPASEVGHIHDFAISAISKRVEDFGLHFVGDHAD